MSLFYAIIIVHNVWQLSLVCSSTSLLNFELSWPPLSSTILTLSMLYSSNTIMVMTFFNNDLSVSMQWCWKMKETWGQVLRVIVYIIILFYVQFQPTLSTWLWIVWTVPVLSHVGNKRRIWRIWNALSTCHPIINVSSSPTHPQQPGQAVSIISVICFVLVLWVLWFLPCFKFNYLYFSVRPDCLSLHLSRCMSHLDMGNYHGVLVGTCTNNNYYKKDNNVDYYWN